MLLCLALAFLCLYFSLKARLAREKKLQGPEKYKQYASKERVFTCVVVLQVLLFICNIVLYSVVKPALYYKLA
jgi:ABC-type Fe3+ transport system permease subunit